MVFFFNDTATTEIYTLSLHDALPICLAGAHRVRRGASSRRRRTRPRIAALGGRARHAVDRARGRGRRGAETRSEEHTSELQSRQYLVCRLLLEKKTINQPALLYIPDS